MAPLDCRLITHSDSEHLAQLYTGFTLLERAGAVKLSQRCVSGPAKTSHLRAVVEGVWLHYDMHDSGAVDEEAAAEADFYFKRSYAPSAVPAALRPKVLPYGLNYSVYPEGFDRLALERLLRLPGRTPKNKLKRAAELARLLEAPTAASMQAPPDHEAEPRLLFMTRLWDGKDELNEMRAACVRLLRKELGAACTAGLKPTPLAASRYPDLLAEESTRRGDYLALLRRYPICVTTTGLWGSIGGKLGEYVAFSKAIVTEPLSYAVTGGFGAGVHYLEFRTAQDCVEQAVRLFEDKELRDSMMRANHVYYQAYLRPDALVARTLLLAQAA